MTASRSELLAAVAQAIVDSGYAMEQNKVVTPLAVRKARCVSRQDFIAALADDERLHSHKRAQQSELIDEVSYLRGVKRDTAKQMLGEARKLTR